MAEERKMAAHPAARTTICRGKQENLRSMKPDYNDIYRKNYGKGQVLFTGKFLDALIIRRPLSMFTFLERQIKSDSIEVPNRTTIKGYPFRISIQCQLFSKQREQEA